MAQLEQQLARWRDAGLLTPEQAAEIATFEANGAPAAGPAPARAEQRTGRSTLAAEAIGYVGAALAVGAIIMLVQDFWQQLAVGGKLALVALLTALVAAAATALHRADRAPLQRLASVLFTAAVYGLGWVIVILTADVLAWREADVALATMVPVTAAAGGLYVWRQRALPQLTAFAAGLGLVAALLARPALEPEAIWIGLLFWALGGAWLLLGLGRWLHPRIVAELSGGVVALLALQFSSFEDARLLMLVLAVATAGALVGLAIATERAHHLGVGAVGLFILVPQLAFELFGDAIGAPATLLVVGLLLVLLAVGLGRARREVRSAAPTGGEAA